MAESPADLDPAIVPAVQHRAAGKGVMALPSAPHIRYEEPALTAVAAQMAADIEAVTGRPVTVAASGAPVPGEMVLRLDSALDVGEGAGQDEAYRLRVDTTVTITGRSVSAVRWGMVSLLQMIRPDGTLPCGTVEDWPDYPVRGFLLDVGRRYFTPEFLGDLIRCMGWFKLNTFVVHLNDNEITKDTGRPWAEAQHAFRLSTDNPRLAGLAAADGSYTRADWDGLEDVAAAHGVTIVPEIDAPAHSRSFIVFDPSLGHDGGDSDLLDLSRPRTLEFMREVFAEFLPWFRGPYVHFGADEYPPELADDHRTYFNAIAGFLHGHGKRTIAWGSQAKLAGDGRRAVGYDRDVVLCSWNNEWYGPRQAVADGFQVINTNDELLYLVPFADYYHGEHLDGPALWKDWEPHVFPDGQSLEPGHPRLLGSLSALWNDLVLRDYDEHTVRAMIEPTFGLLAQKMWSGAIPGLDHDGFQERLAALPERPGGATEDHA
ncbi:family 20 glycosylhydrolase [Streptomyces sp. NBC_01754]|uniref:family 20 glycosylhydrolase n=1 Tax=Streptomyces sp. NBC_01754 TaxID=2975930 RepID=UPI002DD9385A|nr:family 20 glycosylhydrolase [Streptomyces sp. NBC_01754]WSC96152.1 family 20 glycosylhydrolase [Streptomyces sp. NBC_01754]